MSQNSHDIATGLYTPGWGKRPADLLVPALSVSKRRGWGKRERDLDNYNCGYWLSLLQFIQVRIYTGWAKKVAPFSTFSTKSI